MKSFLSLMIILSSLFLVSCGSDSASTAATSTTKVIATPAMK